MDVLLHPKNPKGEPWKPRLFQTEASKRFNACRYLFLLVPRQFGKTEWGAHVLRDFLFKYENQMNPNALVVMQTYESVNKNYLPRLKAMLKGLPPSVVTIYENKSSEHAYITLKRPWLGDVCTIHFGTASTMKAVDALRGRTINFMLLDEAAYYPEGAWSGVFEPMLDDTKGKAIITSTVNGPNWFMRLDDTAREDQEAGTGYYGHYKLTVEQMLELEPSLREPGFLENKIRSAKRAGTHHVLLQEYYHDYYAGVAKEFPFAKTIRELPNRGVVDMPVHIKGQHNVWVACDIGKQGHYATWAFIVDRISKQPIIIHYSEDHDGIKDFLNNMYNEFHEYNMVYITFPHDVHNKDLWQGGGSFWIKAREHVNNTPRLSKKLVLRDADKPKSAQQDWLYAVSQVSLFRFVTSQCRIGYEKLLQMRFTKDAKTGHVLWGTSVRNSAVHAGDAFRYAVLVYELCKSRTWEEGLDRDPVEEYYKLQEQKKNRTSYLDKVDGRVRYNKNRRRR